jgi:hypothetical protein
MVYSKSLENMLSFSYVIKLTKLQTTINKIED